MSPVAAIDAYTSISFPRVSGDEPPHRIAATVVAMFSPRERG